MKSQLSEKKELFKFAVVRFAKMCGGDIDNYIYGMNQLDGYKIAAKQFHKWSMYLTEHEIFDLYEKEKLPEWMIKCFEEVEFQYFNKVLIWDSKYNLKAE